ncbi:MAG TPA: hypothetical protein VNV85_12710, partial [Puia sp.]|jgi:hypothetical protein|nr:hypothetical protein [Puia sp.]
MHYDYVVTLKKNSGRQIDLISIFLCTFSVLAFVFEQIRESKFDYTNSLFAIIVTSGVLYNLFISKKGRPARYKYLLFISGIYWIVMPYLSWVSIVLFFLAFLEYQAKHPLEVGFVKEEVVINTLIKRKFTWSSFNNIILKEGLLTLDFKNNKIFQKETLDDDEPDADEQEFNEYCRKQLLKSNEDSPMTEVRQLKR